MTILPASSPPNTEDPADLDSILRWDAPHEDIEIELQKIDKAIDEKFEKLGLVVAYD